MTKITKRGGQVWDLLKRSAGEMAEMVEPGSTTRETPSVREVAESMLPRDPYEVVGEAQKKFKEGDRIGAFEEMLGGIPETGAIRAYHGSPYAFDRFDLSKIGTGEGAQVYGHGLYFAESEPVARSYRDNLQRVKPSDLPEYFSPGNVVPSYFGKDKVLDFKQDKDGHFEVLVQEINNAGEPVGAPRVHSTRPSVESFKQVTGKNPGHMYEVDIHADPEHFLDWDKSMREQRNILEPIIESYGGKQNLSQKVSEFEDLSNRVLSAKGSEAEDLMRQWDAARRDPKQRLGEFLKDLESSKGTYGYDPGAKATGEKFYRAISSNAPKASDKLLELGTPGIKYLDAGSRSAGEGSRNYVMFSHDPVEIVRRYNQGGHVLEDDYPTHYLPNVGRQVMADGGVPSIDQIRQMLVGTAPAPSGPTPRAYTDPYGLKVAAPFVESMRGGYPTSPSMATAAPTLSRSSLADLLGSIFGRRRSGYDQGGPVVEGDVSFLEDEPFSLPTFAQPQAQEVTQALDAAREVNQPKKEYEPFGMLPLKETEQGIEFDPYAGIMGSVTRPAKYFYETMTGQKEMDPTSEEAIRAATDIAGTLTMGSGAFERPAGALAAGASRPGMGHNMPPEAIVPERVTNPLGMHSEAAEVARNLPQQRGTIEQMLAMMKQKVNPEELHWSGVAEAFQPGQKVTAEELASHFESKLPQVQETMYGGPGHEFKYGNQDWTHEQWRNAITRAERNRNFGLAEAIMSEWEASEGLGVKSKAPMYPGYVTPGGSNYREIVLHHPPSWKPEIVEKHGRFGFAGPDGRYRDYYTRADAEQSARSMARHDVDGFTESHYDEPNVLGHLRMSDMEGPGGEKILNVHEFQSDWGQQARKKGVVTPDLESKLDSVKLRLEKAGNEYYKMQDDLNQLINSGQITYRDSFEHPMFQEVENARQNYVKLEEQRKALAQQSRGVPHSPYVTSREGQHNTPGWTDLLIKRVLQEAERGGYDKVVWDTPAEQAQRYMNQPQIVKGMQGYYGDLLPRRHKKVAPEIKIGEHEVGKPGSPIKGEEVADWLAKYVGPSSDYNKYKSAVERMPDAGPEQWLKASGLYDDYVIIKATEMGHEDPLNGLEVTNFGGKWNLYDRDVAKGVFDSKKEAYAAKKTLAGEKATKLLNQSTVKRPGFEMTPELKERIRRGLSAYRYGGEVEDALDVARSLK